MVLPKLAASLPLLAIAAATPLQLHARQNASSPCAAVSASVASQSAAATPTVAAQLAYDCISSVPLNKSAALDLLDGVVPYFRWQSNTVWLKDPPAEYAEKVQPGIDVWGGLAEIRSKVEDEAYGNEFEFGFALYTLLQRTHDGHFVFIPDVVGTVFNWARPVPLVSISADGVELPKPYVYADVLAESFSNASFIPSSITKINGQDALEFLEDWAQRGSLQDRDALYNNVFYELATVSLGPAGSGIGTFAGSGRGRWVYPGPETELEFENGTTVTYTNYAKVLIPFDGITDGESLYRLWFTGNPPTGAEPSPSPTSNVTTSTASATATATVTPIPAPGYPPPVIREEANLIGGYYLEDEYSDIAVLSVPSFASSESETLNFQDVAEQFLAAAKAAGKKKLVVDVQANGGGTILQGYDLYKQLFPQGISHAAADRFRAFEETDLLGQKFSDIAETLPRIFEPEGNDTLLTLTEEVVSSVFNYQNNLNEDSENFQSWDDMFGPVEMYGDNFTDLFRWNLSDVLIPYSSGGIYIHGFGNLTNFTQPFAAEDIVVVTDGYCASTCTIFSELMRQRAGVRYISLGGRSKPGITQAIGGVKGTNNYPWTYIQYLAQYTINNLTSTDEEAAQLNTTALGDYYDDTVFIRQAINTSVNVNFRDGIRDGDETETPLQFVWEPSDCRILYTREMTVDVTAIWKAVADTAWGGEDKCVAGSLGGYARRGVRREMTVQDHALSRRMHQWRRELHEEDYPLDVFTDLSKAKLSGNAIFYP